MVEISTVDVHQRGGRRPETERADVEKSTIQEHWSGKTSKTWLANGSWHVGLRHVGVDEAVFAVGPSLVSLLLLLLELLVLFFP